MNDRQQARFEQAELSSGIPFLAEPELTMLERTIGAPNFRPAYWLEVGVQRAAAVCKLTISNSQDYQGRAGSWAGTGFMVSEHILLTNHHVLNSPATAKNAVAIFNYEQHSDGSRVQTTEYRLNPDRLFLTSPLDGDEYGPGLDFTFVWIEGTPGQTFGVIPLLKNLPVVAVGEPANIIQHPQGHPKQIAVQENTVVGQTASTIRYTTDTEPGSSGACVMNNDWTPIALHHASGSDGQPGTFYNEGITFAAIATRLEAISRDPSRGVAARELLAVFQTATN